jgi:hypothetical protein
MGAQRAGTELVAAVLPVLGVEVLRLGDVAVERHEFDFAPEGSHRIR